MSIFSVVIDITFFASYDGRCTWDKEMGLDSYLDLILEQGLILFSLLNPLKYIFSL
jgi:hypothetical protein